MKKIVASVGLVALGASGLQAASLPDFLTESGKPWSVSATLRGFYDDNINSAPDGIDLDAAGFDRDSFGFQISPAIDIDLHPSETTTLKAGYKYTFLYYDNQLAGSLDHNDQTHQFDLALDHAFSERYRVSLGDSFVIGQQPDMLRTGNALTSFQRVPGDNIRNFGEINVDAKVTRLLNIEVGYANAYYDYDAQLYSALLDRMEHSVHVDTRWQMDPTTVGIVGAMFREVDYTDDALLIAPNIFSDARDSRSYVGYLGLDHTFRPDLTGNFRVGGQYTDYFNDPSDSTTVSPYFKGSLRWTYRPESFIEVGVTHDRNATDWLGAVGNQITVDQESTVVYASLVHRITSNLSGRLMGRFQDSEFNGGASNNMTERYYMLGADVEYRFNPNLSASVGYTYDNLDSDLWLDAA